MLILIHHGVGESKEIYANSNFGQIFEIMDRSAFVQILYTGINKRHTCCPYRKQTITLEHSNVAHMSAAQTACRLTTVEPREPTWPCRGPGPSVWPGGW
jgi:hypothetical protein